MEAAGTDTMEGTGIRSDLGEPPPFIIGAYINESSAVYKIEDKDP